MKLRPQTMQNLKPVPLHHRQAHSNVWQPCASSWVLALVCCLLLQSSPAVTAAAAAATHRKLLAGFPDNGKILIDQATLSTPTSPIFLPYSKSVTQDDGSVTVTHGYTLWVVDHLNGLCRTDPDPADSAKRVINSGTCTSDSLSQVDFWGPWTDSEGNDKYYVFGTTIRETILRYDYDPAGDNGNGVILKPVTDARGNPQALTIKGFDALSLAAKKPGTSRTWGLAVRSVASDSGPAAELIVSFKGVADIMKLSGCTAPLTFGANGLAVSELAPSAAVKIGKTSDNKGAGQLVLAENTDVYIMEANNKKVTRILNVGNINGNTDNTAASLPSAPGTTAIAAIAYQPIEKKLLVADVMTTSLSQILSWNPNNLNTPRGVYRTAGTATGGVRVATGMLCQPNGDLYVVDDAPVVADFQGRGYIIKYNCDPSTQQCV